jgi:hypothetical protein
MSFELRGIDLTFPAEEDLSADQYRYVVLTATGTVQRPDAATDIPVGILQNAPAADGAAVVRLLGAGASKAVLGATLAIGALVQAEYVGAADAGKAIAAASTGYPAGQVLQGGAEDDLGTVLLVPMTVKV